MVHTGSRLLTLYERTLWQTMAVLGITESIERKVLTAIVLQFLATIAIFVLPFFVSGTVFFALAAVSFVLAAVAGANTVLVVRRDVIAPVLDLEATATEMAQGTVKLQAERSDQPDEIGSLQNAFVELAEFLDTVGRQADALSRQQFDDPVLEEDVPGAFGESMSRMTTSLRDYSGSEAKAHPFRGVDEADMTCHKPRDIG